MAHTLAPPAPRAPSSLRTFLLACLSIMVIGAMVAAAVVFSTFSGVDHSPTVFSYLVYPSQELLSPMFDAVLPADLDGPEAGVSLILLSAWVQASVIVGAVLAVGWMLLAMFRATGRQTG